MRTQKNPPQKQIKTEKQGERRRERYNEENQHFLSWKHDPNVWKSSAGIYALKTSGREEGGIMADWLSLWDHNDDKESIRV